MPEIRLRDRLKPLAARVLQDYEIYWIFRCQAMPERARLPAQECVLTEVDAAGVKALPSALLRGQAAYAGDGAHAFLATLHGVPAGLCFYWSGERYRTRNFWPLRPGEAKLVQLVVDPAYRGRGIATRLIANSAATLAEAGLGTLYARVWHSNAPSIGAFHHAGWRRIALVVTLLPRGVQRRVRIALPWRER